MTVTVYSKPACQYCVKAKDLLERLGYEYTEKIVTKDISLEEFFKELGKTVRTCLLYTSPSPRDKRQSRMPSSA